MAKEVVWSSKFSSELQKIFEFWDDHNQSTIYSSMLMREITDAFAIIKDNDLLGKETSRKNVRVIVIDKFLVFYKITKQNILVLAIFDGRRNPFDLKLNK